MVDFFAITTRCHTGVSFFCENAFGCSQYVCRLLVVKCGCQLSVVLKFLRSVSYTSLCPFCRVCHTSSANRLVLNFV